MTSDLRIALVGDHASAVLAHGAIPRALAAAYTGVVAEGSRIPADAITLDPPTGRPHDSATVFAP